MWKESGNMTSTGWYLHVALVVALLRVCVVQACVPKPDSSVTLPPRDPGIVVPITSQSSSSSSSSTSSSSPSSAPPSSSPPSSTASTSSTTSTAPQSTVDPREAFLDDCQNTLIGQVNGGRCFFVPTNNATYSWDDSWTACTQLGGGLAQIMTSAEMTVLSQYLTTRLGPGGQNASGFIWIALRRDPSTTDLPNFLPLDTTFWYENPTTPNELLSAGNTWLRNQGNGEDEYTAENECIHLWSDYTLLGDYSCASALRPLCQILDTSGTVEQFRYFNNTCMSELSVDTVQDTTESAACARACRARSWCRSYNFVNGNECELYPWVTGDQANVTLGTPQCDYYEYIS